MSDTVELMKKEAHEKECASEPESEKCEFCHDTGTVVRQEWSGTDDNYEKEEKCVCQD